MENLPLPIRLWTRTALTALLALILAGERGRAAPAPAGAGRDQPAVLRAISHGLLPRGERITIEFSHEVGSAGDRVGSPDRVYFDFTNSTASSGVIDAARAIRGVLITSVRVGRHPNGTTRVVLELSGKPRYSTFALYSPFRFVIDVEAAAPLGLSPPSGPPPAPPAPKASAAEAPLPPPGPPPTVAPPPTAQPPAAPPQTAPTSRPLTPSITSRGDYSLARQLGLRVSRIVIDPGHGGHDPGARANGVGEAELVLDVALRLEKLLAQQPAVEVVLTRRTDEFVALEERTAIANRENAHLFLSIHANASRQTSSRGIETYFLNFATNPNAEAVAARENAASGRTMDALSTIVKAIALNNKVDESRELAGIVQTSLVRRMRLHSRSVKDLGVKQAPFVVLIGAEMPSVLTEISFVTNAAEAGLLKQAAYRQRIAEALADAIIKYQGSLKKVTTIAGSANRE